MLERRLEALSCFFSMQKTSWGPDLSGLELDDICYYLKPVVQKQKSWGDVPLDIKKTFDYLGIDEGEQKYLAGLGAQYESEMVYHHLQQEWQEKGVVFIDTETGLREHEEIFKRYFGSIVPLNDNYFAALNTALWSGGSFIFVPAGVCLTVPLQAFFRIQSEHMGQFERTLIIAESGSQVTYLEGCSAPAYTTASLHSAVVEIIAHPNAHVRYVTLQNWSKNVYNLVTKRAIAYENATIEWVDGNIGGQVSMKYPTVILQGTGARADITSVALATAGQNQDCGGRVIHKAPKTTSRIISKSMSSCGGHNTYRGAIIVDEQAGDCSAFVQCDSLLLDDMSTTQAYPLLRVCHDNAIIRHEATVSALDEEKIFYLMSRGLSSQEAQALLANSFLESFIRQLPSEFAVEITRLIDLSMAAGDAS
jgi:Fe-S cluster assembly protein SufB